MTAPAFAQTVGIKVGVLRYWARQLGARGDGPGGSVKGTAPAAIRIVPVVPAMQRPTSPASSGTSERESSTSPVVVHLGKVRIELREGFDRRILSEVLSVIWELS
jgi:hypothetical protein